MSSKLKEVTLDPENWEEFKTLGHKMLEDMMHYLETIRNQPYIPTKEDSKNAILTPLPNKGDGEEKVYSVFREHIVPHTVKKVRPDFWGVVQGTGSPFGMLIDLILSGINHGSLGMMFINHHAIDWMKELLDYPKEAGGVFVSGGSEANFTGLAVARNKKAEIDVKAEGMQHVTEPMTLYCSEEAHDCLDRSVELLGLGNEALRWIPINENHQMDVDLLENEITLDRDAGNNPFCIIGTAGTVHTGAFDDLNALADLCERWNLWFHVDGAFGSWVRLSESHKYLADGLERADSVAVDLHKWMNMPYAIGCTLVKNRRAHFSTFVYGHDASYLKTGVTELGDVLKSPLNLSLALSRPDLGGKAYMLLRAFGRDKYAGLIQQNIDQIYYLAELIRKEPNLEIAAPVISNIVCFRYVHDGLNEGDIERLNRMILRELWKINFWMISDTVIKGRYVLRACNVNHRTRYSDFNVLVERIISLGETLVKEYL